MESVWLQIRGVDQILSEAALLNDEYWLELPQTYELIAIWISEKAKEIYESVMEKPNPDEKALVLERCLKPGRPHKNKTEDSKS